MAITRTIGKNTLGDNNKMHIRLREYDMSSQNLSVIFRSTMGVGMLVPFMKIVCQKGDIFDIKLTNKTMTHPTLGPLFGSFKLQHFIFTAGFRLYNSWLHNNRTGIGMKMSDIKLPVFSNYFEKDKTEAKNEPSSLYSYLGWKGSRRTEPNTKVNKQSVPLLMYFDIFKNYFANTQEDNFYIITGSTQATVTFNQQSQDDLVVQIGVDAEHSWTEPLNNTANLEASSNVKNYGDFWTSLVIKVYNPSSGRSLTVYINRAATNYSTREITLDKIGKDELAGYTTIQGIYIKTPVMGDSANYQKMFNNSLGSMLSQQKLETLDKVRDEILKNPGNKALDILSTTDENVNSFFTSVRTASQNKLGGLAIKTYDSDIFNNWVKTDWIDGENGISKITALKPDEDGTITMDALNLQQKVYNMLNRIAVSGGTYRDWLETVYTAGRYLDRPETPVFQGGMSHLLLLH